ncbi:hypothetical protein ACFRCG_03150 [Embleya sp. NPDC056575]|uniref:hypothetical protein n=1 Tax=unclassified Embleya TaxID=2699296 RepID=UPI00369973EB
MFPSTITDFWRIPAPTSRLPHADDTLDEDERLGVLTTIEGTTRVLLTPAVASTLGLDGVRPVDEAALRERLAASDITLNGADNLFYFTTEARRCLGAPAHRRRRGGVRPVRGGRVGTGPRRRVRRTGPPGRVRRLGSSRGGMAAMGSRLWSEKQLPGELPF